MSLLLNQVDAVEVLTLQDNYVDLLVGDNTDVVTRAMPVKGGEIRNSVLGEHGFSALVTLVAGQTRCSVLFDFGFSEHGAAFNADALDVDVTAVETLILSHGHIDHRGGLKQLVQKIGRQGIELVLHPAAFRNPRYLKVTEQMTVHFPPFTREGVEALGVKVVEATNPYELLNGSLLFLGEIPRESGFEKGMPNAYYAVNGDARPDPIEDDTAIVAHVRGKGLVILSGCAHSGIINTVRYAQRVTGVKNVFVVMGGFHLTGAGYADSIQPTLDALKVIGPRWVVPTHCTGRNAVMRVEQQMADAFLLNMVGTRMKFAA